MYTEPLRSDSLSGRNNGDSPGRQRSASEALLETSRLRPRGSAQEGVVSGYPTGLSFSPPSGTLRPSFLSCQRTERANKRTSEAGRLNANAEKLVAMCFSPPPSPLLLPAPPIRLFTCSAFLFSVVYLGHSVALLRQAPLSVSGWV